MSSPTPDDRSPLELGSTPPSDPEFDAALRALARPPQLSESTARQVAALEQDGFGGALSRTAVAAQDDTSPRVDSVLDDRYRIVSTLGRGGMGVVFGAENIRTGKRVALKWMALERADPARQSALIARFDREARAVAKVRHPNVVDVYDVGYWQGKPFLVMELLQGETLRSRIARGRLTWDEARPLLLGVLRGVAAVHRAGVVHRDLKPDNIFLCGVEGEPHPLPKVLDFGVAAMRDSESANDALTRTGAILGTPSYMALEQLTGEQVDARADVYALGVLLYEMLTQQLPYSARSAADLAVLQATKPPIRPSRHAADLPSYVERLVLGALASDPAKRFASAEAWAQAIERATRSAPRLPLWLAIGGVTLLAGVSFAWPHGAPPRGRQRAEPRTNDTMPVAQPQRVEPSPVADSGAPRESAATAAAEPQPATPVVKPEPRRQRGHKRPASAEPASAPEPPAPSLTGITVDDF